MRSARPWFPAPGRGPRGPCQCFSLSRAARWRLGARWRGMRILHVSDVHCDSVALYRLLKSLEYDLVAATGDLECVETAEVLVSKAKAPVLAVTGNTDTAAVARVLREAGVLIDGRVVEAGGLRFAGVGGMDPRGSIERLLSVLPEGGVDVLLSHHPPKGVLDRVFFGLRAGLRELWRVIEAARPGLHLFGHIHESPGVEEREGVLFVNAGSLMDGRYAVVEGPPWRARLVEE